MDDRERVLTVYAHDTWTGWMQYMFDMSKLNSDGSLTIPSELVRRWSRQVSTAFDDLPVLEQQADVDEAKKILRVLQASPTTDNPPETFYVE